MFIGAIIESSLKGLDAIHKYLEKYKKIKFCSDKIHISGFTLEELSKVSRKSTSLLEAEI